ncbi:MAG: ribosome small subunit-dependent GTPase A [Bacillota bacterium]
MGGKRRKSEDAKDLTSRYLTGRMEQDPLETQERFSRRSANAQQRKIERTALLRAAEEAESGEIEGLPIGRVLQVYSLYCDVELDGVIRLCVVRKTLSKLSETALVVGDWVRFREIGAVDEQGRPEAVVEQILPRRTVLTRADSFKAIEQQPIVANADQMLVVVALHEPEVKWGLVDRMIVAAQSGGLRPVVCVNKVDLASERDRSGRDLAHAREILGHYRELGIRSFETSVPQQRGLDELGEVLRGQTTVLAGHSGVGKSSLINAIQPGLDLRIGAISGYTGKGRHTTTSSRRYRLKEGTYVIDTPGVKLFGLWGVTQENLLSFFPDVEAGTAPEWREESYGRILESLG